MEASIICFLIIIAGLASCNGQSANLDSCKGNLLNAKNSISAYYTQASNEQLNKTVEFAQKALACDETRRAAVETKLSALLLLKQYEQASGFVDSLNESDFKYKYRKRMMTHFLKGWESELRGDSSKGKDEFEKSLESVQQFILREKLPDSSLEETYYDLFMVKSKILDKQTFDHEIDSFAGVYPHERQFLEALKESFYENGKVSEPVQEIMICISRFITIDDFFFKSAGDLQNPIAVVHQVANIFLEKRKDMAIMSSF